MQTEESIITSVEQLSAEQLKELKEYISAYTKYQEEMQLYLQQWTQYCTWYYSMYGTYPNTNAHGDNTSATSMQVTSTLPSQQSSEENQQSLQIQEEPSFNSQLVFAICYKTTKSGRAMIEVAEAAIKKIYPDATVLRKQSADPQAICSVVLVSAGGRPINDKVWVKVHDIQHHFMSTPQSDQEEIEKSIKEAVESISHLMGKEKTSEDIEYEKYTALLSE
ncbi:uncharacterized protein MONOS_9534 [Monocercomonoides exilis]|uniref:uncharacterized protein n=1 Tax=Monocercomonoides exilis TaxID=2049356 RepID=UPI00355ABFF9|nr:hypothetical protein MONOS_9534 [Monocercomonoides exilis]|eukprot:MONOS_9534.1-p1 / transcript=MONOS_9534.1 / gene=MONOS_9534 / organism=Monocercomonoides_exilis_PA203 / gene_product=unspecified product / transcript_product=unspecified product / location=Mono_scaffold00397:36524-37322(-) / protein_length=221 / sequence_SO=supercontig / SO=protein_coding / is_pseudo=false